MFHNLYYFFYQLSKREIIVVKNLLQRFFLPRIIIEKSYVCKIPVVSFHVEIRFEGGRVSFFRILIHIYQNILMCFREMVQDFVKAVRGM